MNLTERINKLKGYFQLFNITDDAAYVLVSFPDTWSVPEKVDDDVSVTRGEGSTYYFYCEPDKDTEILFDGIDYVVEFNKAIEEKTKLLVEKVEELKELFANEDLDKLRTLTFTFQKTPSKKNQNLIASLDLAVKPKTSDKKKKEKKTAKVEEPKKEVKKEEPKVADVPDGSIMKLAKNMVGE